ncbi:class I SAM-dependent methyltransferase [Duganella qianjiadongensis]|uniref:Methyltransferase domain-containing protein n=1 Tax=Duganella qianjiadongensis TaxID=2692176 RepID=A0ABW9VRA8_9BURK|nr:class I SAM-dependent methyltransferase [Duganella qianjiadongensis]MYM42111.1 methyltransferase domain-containing protein [Duganella qianjiadongensis]
MKYLSALKAWLHLLGLLTSPPALFRHLHGLYWYRSALMATLPRTAAHLAGVTALEIGCATGEFCGVMVTLGASVHGVDRSASMVQQASARHAEARFTVADASALPYPDAGFDIVLAASLLNVVADPVAVLREMARVCRHGGALALLVPARDFTTRQARQWIARQGMRAHDAAAYLLWHWLARKVSDAELNGWLQQAGLAGARVVSQQLMGGLATALHVYPPASQA